MRKQEFSLSSIYNVLFKMESILSIGYEKQNLKNVRKKPLITVMNCFQALIEKEWLSFGHKFTDRCGFLSSVDPKETSPVFTQFLEAVWQMTCQFPCAFQFNEPFLLTLHDHVYSCQFGTFIGNCEKDRIDLK